MSWWPRPVRTRKRWPVFIGQCLAVLAVAYTLGWWFSNLYEFGVARGKPCMPGRFYFIERLVPGRVLKFQRGDLIVFRTDNRTSPYYQRGTRFIKVVHGVPGDRVVIDDSGKVQINGKNYHFETALETKVADLLGRKLGDCAVNYVIPEGRYFAMGTLPDSYDSRYWGMVHPDQIMGKGLAVWGR